jgi:predicted Ser/Thr protein kinase
VRRASVEREIYDQQVSSAAVGKHVAPHATEVAAQWAVLTRLKRPLADRYPPELRPLVERLTPVEKLRLYDAGAVPDRLGQAQAKLLRKHVSDLWHESDVYPHYEGWSGASAREVKTALLNAAQAPGTRCLTPQAVLAELTALCQDQSVHEFLQQEVIEGYHGHEQFVRAVEASYLDALDEEIRDSMGMVSESQYRELFGRYVGLVSHWVKGEKLKNRVTGAFEPPDEARMVELEALVMQPGDDRQAFRRALISAIGAFRLDHPGGEEIDYVAIFPDLFRRLRDHYFEERRRQLTQSKEHLLRYLSDDQGGIDARALLQVEATLATMRSRYGYCEHCAKDAILFLMRRRYED